MARLASAIGLRSPTCSRRAVLRASRSSAAARAFSAASTAASTPTASSGDRAVSSDILTFQCRFWAAGTEARRGSRRTSTRPADKSRGARSGPALPVRRVDGLLRCASALPGNGPGKSTTTGRLRTRCHAGHPATAAATGRARSARPARRAGRRPAGTGARRHQQQLVDLPARPVVHGERPDEPRGDVLVPRSLQVRPLTGTVRARGPPPRRPAPRTHPADREVRTVPRAVVDRSPGSLAGLHAAHAQRALAGEVAGDAHPEGAVREDPGTVQPELVRLDRRGDLRQVGDQARRPRRPAGPRRTPR